VEKQIECKTLRDRLTKQSPTIHIVSLTFDH